MYRKYRVDGLDLDDQLFFDKHVDAIPDFREFLTLINQWNRDLDLSGQASCSQFKTKTSFIRAF